MQLVHISYLTHALSMSDNERLRRPLSLWLESDTDRLLEDEKARTKKSKTALVNESVRAHLGGKA